MHVSETLFSMYQQFKYKIYYHPEDTKNENEASQYFSH